MKKYLTIDPRAEKELRKFSEKVRLGFEGLIYILIKNLKVAERRLKEYEQQN